MQVDGVAPPSGEYGRTVGEGTHHVWVASAEPGNRREGLMLFFCDDRPRGDIVAAWFKAMATRMDRNDQGSLALAEADRIFQDLYVRTRGAALIPGELKGIELNAQVEGRQEIADGIYRYIALYPVAQL